MQRIRSEKELKELPPKTFKQEFRYLQSEKKKVIKKIQTRNDNILILDSDRRKTTPDDRKNMQRLEAEKIEFENDLLGMEQQEEQFHRACKSWFL